jgi:dipeptidyl aminopeptidase/acylaminoacyl peptidase
MHMESTLAALDVAVARGFIDESRVGIGGVSQGSLVPLFTMIKHDRFAALALSGGGWDPLEYYFLAKQGRAGMHGGYDFLPKPDAAGWNFWQQRSIAENVGAIEAPILFNATAAEMYTLIRLTRNMDEAGKPYDAYVYPRETHIKFQPAHLDSIMRRNVDWLRFWLQSYEDPAPEKAVQYERWRKLRELQQAQRVSNASGG